MAWYSSDYKYRQKITITNALDEALSNYQIKLTVDHSALVTAGKALASGYDFRFTSSDGSTLIDHYLYKGANTATCVIWVEVPTIGASSGGTTDIYMYYGYASAADASSGPNTFIFFDDFEDGTYAGKWQISSPAPDYYAETGGIFTLYNTTNKYTGMCTANTYTMRNIGIFADVDMPVTISGSVGWGTIYTVSFGIWNHGNFLNQYDDTTHTRCIYNWNAFTLAGLYGSSSGTDFRELEIRTKYDAPNTQFLFVNNGSTVKDVTIAYSPSTAINYGMSTYDGNQGRSTCQMKVFWIRNHRTDPSTAAGSEEFMFIPRLIFAA